MQPDVVDYASRPPPRPARGPLPYAPLFAAVLAGIALLKSRLYHGYGQLRDEQITTLALAVLSLPCLLLALTLMPRYRRKGKRKLFVAALLCVAAAVCAVLAVWSLSTATVGAKDRLF